MTQVAVTEQQLIFNYGNQAIPYLAWRVGAEPLKTIVLSGTVQIGKITEWVAGDCPAGTIVVEGAPLWLAQPDGHDTIQFVYDFTKQAIDQILERENWPAVDIIAESQAAPAVIRLCHRGGYEKRLRRLAFIQPLGLTPAVYAGSARQRVRLFKKRLIKNLWFQLGSLPTDRKLRYNYRQLARFVSVNDPSTNAQYAAGLLTDVLDELKALLGTGCNIKILCGEYDTLFPAKEIISALRSHGITMAVDTVPGVPHSSLAVRKGQRLLAAAFRANDSASAD